MDLITQGLTSIGLHSLVLCASCRNIKTQNVPFVGDFQIIPFGRDLRAYYIHLTLPELRSSARWGCPCCRIILSELEKGSHSQEKADREGYLRLDYPRDYPTSGKKPSIIYQGWITSAILYRTPGYPKDGEDFQTKFEFTEKSYDPPAIGATAVIHRNLEDDPESDYCYSLVQSWLENCVLRHSRCVQSATSLPARVLDVTLTNPVLIDGTAIKARYTILSHCWGARSAVTTTTITEKEGRREIVFSTLPATFRDAVTITRRLRVQYLWIDSLCIIQDDIADWAVESARMKEYYHMAYLTISAIDSPNSDTGIFLRRKGVPTVSLPAEPGVYLRAPLPQMNLVFSESVLNSRAWALQERLLSTRILHYSKEEIYWECNTCSRREGSIEEQVDKYDASSQILSEGGDFKRILLGLSLPQDTSRCMIIWYRLVTQYTKRYLTRESDKLPAISGIASAISDVTGYKYLAGIWKQDLQGLLWFRVSMWFSSADRAPSWSYSDPETTYRAPSWSWASVNGPISFRFDSEKPITSPEDAEIIDDSTACIGVNSFGQAINGFITLRAMTMDLQYSSRGPSSSVLLKGRPPPLLQSPSQPKDAGPVSVESQQPTVSATDYQPSLAEANLDYLCDSESDGEEKFCTAILIQRRVPSIMASHKGFSPEQKRTHSAIYCLLVEENPEVLGQWRRIGTAIIYDTPLRVFTEMGLGSWSLRREMRIV